ncbi:protein SMG7-like isoform X2 [Varroa jacobsoni]|uniref:protein SMG7-like isoform X2 n=1 Tax=Varroa jacobsoni TaxID=62625 RepID=UPI000BF6469A|nr:protein SMG7-like isoform X2 [Varroa jacobsoni]
MRAVGAVRGVSGSTSNRAPRTGGGGGGGGRGGISETALQKLDRAKQELGASKDALGGGTHELRKDDLEYALGRKLEQDLWNMAFRASISALQKEASLSREGSLKLGLMIDLSSGYFLQLLQRLVQRYRVTELKMMPGPDCLGIMDVRDDSSSSEQDHIRIAKRSRVLYICQYCLVHLGDLARYRNDLQLAESYYRQAVDIEPRNGHPYNQLGLLEGAKGNRLATLFLYVRALSVSHPFVVAVTNLESMYSKLIQEEQSSRISPPMSKESRYDSRMAPAELTGAFLHFISLVHLNQQPALARKILSTLMLALPRLVCSEKLDEQTLLQMATMALYTFTRSKPKSPGTVANTYGKKSITEAQLVEVDGAAKMMSEFVFGLFRCVLLANVSSTVANPAIATALLLLEALLANPKNVSINPVNDLWYVLRTVLNSFARQLTLDWKDEALPEDFELRGFLPLRMVQSKLKFASHGLTRAQAAELRLSRFVKQGKELCKVKFLDGSAIISFIDDEFRAKECTTEDDLVKELERIRLDKDDLRPAVRFNVDEPIDPRREKPKRQNVALQAIMNQRQAPPPEPVTPGSIGTIPFTQPPPPLNAAPKWNLPAPVAPPPAPALMHPSGTYPMTIEELVKQPPPPIYNVDLRLVPPPTHSLTRPQQGPTPTSLGFNNPNAMPGQIVQSNTYSLFSGGSWNPQMGTQMGSGHTNGPRPPLLPLVGLASAGGIGNAPRPQGGSLWKPEKGPQGTSALERLLKETKKTKDP